MAGVIEFLGEWFWSKVFFLSAYFGCPQSIEFFPVVSRSQPLVASPSSKRAQGATTQLIFPIIMIAIAAVVIILVLMYFYGGLREKLQMLPGAGLL